MHQKALNLGGAGSDNSTMERQARPIPPRAAVVALCAALFVVLAGRGTVAGMETAKESTLARTVSIKSAASEASDGRRRQNLRSRAARVATDNKQLRSTTPTGPSESFNPSPGQVVFEMDIPSIDLHETVVQGVEASQLARGPGHYPSCGVYFSTPYCSEFEQVWPGEVGRTVVGAHRTMAGAEFFDLGELRSGDDIRIRAPWGDFVYRVTRQQIVDDGDRSIIVPGIEARELVLVTCHPKFSSAQRLLIYARLVPPAAPSEPERPAKPETDRGFPALGL